MGIAVIGSPANESTVRLVERWRGLGLVADLVAPADALRVRSGDVAIGRLDVRASVYGVVEPGLLELLLLERRGIDVRNATHALLGAHDKLRTARLLASAHVPHPRTCHLRAGELIAPPLPPPLVLKPRFGSWGVDVRRCATADDVEAYLRQVGEKPWYRRHGVLRRVVGAVERTAAAREWRTNISCGGTARPVAVSPAAAELAATAAAAVDADLIGVDLFPLGDDRYVVVELNGAIDFDDDYSFPGQDVYAAAASALGLLRSPARPVREPILTAGCWALCHPIE